MPNGLRVSNLSKRRGDFRLGPLDFVIEGGETVALAGPNGSGKTTLLYLLAGFLRPDEGSIHFDRYEWTEEPPEARRVGFVFGEPTLFSALSVEKNLRFSPRSRHVPTSRWSSIVHSFALEEMLSRPAGALSLGERRRVELARALLSGPGVLLLDEPFAAVDQRDRAAIAEATFRAAEEIGATLLVTTHERDNAFSPTRFLSLRQGQLVRDR
jgi:ABC-type multidrug transport system ATPase subunit